MALPMKPDWLLLGRRLMQDNAVNQQKVLLSEGRRVGRAANILRERDNVFQQANVLNQRRQAVTEEAQQRLPPKKDDLRLQMLALDEQNFLQHRLSNRYIAEKKGSISRAEKQMRADAQEKARPIIEALTEQRLDINTLLSQINVAIGGLANQVVDPLSILLDGVQKEVAGLSTQNTTFSNEQIQLLKDIVTGLATLAQDNKDNQVYQDAVKDALTNIIQEIQSGALSPTTVPTTLFTPSTPGPQPAQGSSSSSIAATPVGAQMIINPPVYPSPRLGNARNAIFEQAIADRAEKLLQLGVVDQRLDDILDLLSDLTKSMILDATFQQEYPRMEQIIVDNEQLLLQNPEGKAVLPASPSKPTGHPTDAAEIQNFIQYTEETIKNSPKKTKKEEELIDDLSIMLEGVKLNLDTQPPGTPMTRTKSKEILSKLKQLEAIQSAKPIPAKPGRRGVIGPGSGQVGAGMSYQGFIDPVDRLNKILLAMRGGNDSKKLRNEGMMLIDLMLMNKVLKKKDHKALFQFFKR